MKTKIFLAIASLVLLAAPSTLHAGVGISFGVFYSSLGSQGEWISIGGEYGWHPAGIAMGWRPYTMGHWVWTDDGWFWVSDEPWGWATYHYGRWYYDDFYGWIWMPGYDWAPAWVEWRYGGGCVGWAPLGPYAVYRPGFGIYYGHHWETPHSYWSFVDSRHMGDGDIHGYVYRSDDNVRLIGRTRTGGNIRTDGGRIVTRGPDRTYVERTGNIRVNRVEVVDMESRGNARIERSGGTERLQVYRPRVEPRAAGATAERPERVREATRTPSLDVRSTDVGVRQGGQPAAVRQPRTTRTPGAAQAPARREPARVNEGARRPQREVAPAPGRSKVEGAERPRGSERRYEQMPSRPNGAAVQRAPRYERGGQAGRSSQPDRSVRRNESGSKGGERGGERRSR